jgi:predicted methyltransferase
MNPNPSAHHGIEAGSHWPNCLKGFAAATLLALSSCATPGDSSGPPAKALALTGSQIAAVVANPDRSEADRSNDVRRKPAEMLAFIGVRPGMVAEDLSAGGGYTTELLARAVGPTGKVYGQVPPAKSGMQPAADMTPRSYLLVAEREKKPGLGNIVPVLRAFEDPVPPEVEADGLDLVTLMFNYHDLGHLGVDRDAMNKAVFHALKPGGLYVIADHAGRPGTGISESGTLHRIDEDFLRHEVERAGFRFADEGMFLRNPADPRDKRTPEPPMAKDEFVLKFVKP